MGFPVGEGDPEGPVSGAAVVGGGEVGGVVEGFVRLSFRSGLLGPDEGGGCQEEEGEELAPWAEGRSRGHISGCGLQPRDWMGTRGSY